MTSFDAIMRALEDAGCFHSLQAMEGSVHKRLVCASHRSPEGQVRGNSFWVIQLRGDWYLVTWAPRAYFIPPDTDVPQLCVECLKLSDKTIIELPLEFASRHGLILREPSDISEMINGPE